LNKVLEPYRLLFPLGVVFGLLGVSIWTVLNAFKDYNLTAQIHSQLMIGAFLFSFAAGFLMTAIPKMTASFPAQPVEITGAFLLALLNAGLAFSGFSGLFFLSTSVAVFFLILFFLRRFSSRTKSPPPFFPFVILGLSSGLLGSVLVGLSYYIDIDVFWMTLGRRLYFEAMILLLVLGIGSRLIPVISGRGPGDDGGYSSVLRNVGFSLLLLCGFVLQAAGFSVVGGFIKFLAVAFVAWRNWGILAPLKTRSWLASGMRVSGLMVLLGLLLSAASPAFSVHWMHLTYIGGFGLMTLTVASRVTLAHGSYDLSYEVRSRALWVSGVLILLAALTRVAAPFVGAGYFAHLFYAALAWIVAVIVWASVFVTRMVRRGKMSEPACK
jgi:uncharacterized protein involved in response to NO